uniref:Phosphatidylinositol-3,4,5-trisphosphate 3-phosphatase n=1 Tax=Arcella intermedia TaxID=1963864 RepID=A0A6B2KZ32_9EUKA
MTYITDRVIAMGIPGEGIEKHWRNDINAVSTFLNEKHGYNYIIINLTGDNYNFAKFYGQVEVFSFPDHHPPPMELYWAAVEKIAVWLSADEKKVVAVHCLAGRSRTGTIICGYFLLVGLFRSSSEVISFFNVKRSKEGKNVVLPSQVRYVNYFEQTVRDKLIRNKLKRPPTIKLKKIVIQPIPKIENGSYLPKIQIVDLAKSTEKNIVYVKEIIYHPYYSNEQNEVDIIVESEISGDIEVIISHQSSNLSEFTKSLGAIHNKSTRLKLASYYPTLPLFRYIFNTVFVKTTSITVKPPELDAPFAGPLIVNDAIPPSTTVTFYFELLGSVVVHPASYALNPPSLPQKTPSPILSREYSRPRSKSSSNGSNTIQSSRDTPPSLSSSFKEAKQNFEILQAQNQTPALPPRTRHGSLSSKTPFVNNPPLRQAPLPPSVINRPQVVPLSPTTTSHTKSSSSTPSFASKNLNAYPPQPAWNPPPVLPTRPSPYPAQPSSYAPPTSSSSPYPPPSNYQQQPPSNPPYSPSPYQQAPPSYNSQPNPAYFPSPNTYQQQQQQPPQHPAYTPINPPSQPNSYPSYPSYNNYVSPPTPAYTPVNSNTQTYPPTYPSPYPPYPTTDYTYPPQDQGFPPPNYNNYPPPNPVCTPNYYDQPQPVPYGTPGPVLPSRPFMDDREFPM